MTLFALRKWFAVPLLSCLMLIQPLSVVNARSPLTAPSIEQVVDPVMKNEMNNLHIPGAAIVITQGDRILFKKGYGFADVEQQIPVDPERTVFRIGSVTKSLTATAAMQLVEKGKLSLREDLNTVLKDYKITNNRYGPITLHHLLTHTAGIDEKIYKRDNRQSVIPEFSTETVNETLQMQETIFTPGSKFQYSNAGTGLLGSVIEQASGQSLHDYMRENIFRPLGMDSAELYLPQDRSNLAKSYYYDGNGYQTIPYSGIIFPGSGAANMTPVDFAPYMIAHLSGGSYNGTSLLKPETVQLMHAQQFAVHKRMHGIGYGFFKGETKNGIPTLWANGGIDGFISKMVLIPSESIGIFVAVNATHPGLELHSKVVNAFTDKLLTEQVHKPLTPVDGTIDEMKKLEGQYLLTLTPENGWGKGLRLLSSYPYTVKALDGQTISVTGMFQNEGQQSLEKKFVQVDDHFFQEIDGEEQLYFHEEQGNFYMTGPMNFSLPRISFIESPSVLLALYVIPGIVFILLSLVWIARFGLRKWRKQSHAISKIVPIMALLHSLFFIIQFTYANAELVYGYPAFYQVVVASLPIVSLAVAVYLLFRIGTAKERDRWKAANGAAAVLSILYTGYLFYWNFLSFHYS
ncbi:MULTISPECIES: serine hydrolase [Brevibacillus]|uniref:serine hydrolase domain-containing protein n=1 Tax=Brevibacillus TaxID=55080 RepID=UPI000D0E362F|nr:MULTISPECIES: serine hydrolase domain-containing protein [Brevibacillus]MED1945090.1 serine hydrolase [Brevibacillus formosus]MED1996223.1 serine hydrolase [Brevibacillus formosus]MED2081192.1 serine hydrolase [Brevibacillus formosus]PSK14359.1 penicillin-binding protein [Brevibacillus sp. NRRL NRS-603]